MAPLVAVPVKRFYVAKRRLAPLLDPPARSRLGRQLAARTLDVVTSTSATPLVLAGDEVVAEWAAGLGLEVRVDSDGLDRAASVAVAAATERGVPWVVLPADLPLLTAGELETALETVTTAGPVLAPSSDGGTSLIGGTGPFHFGFGPGSFHRHLARLPGPRVLIRLGFALDLDDPADLAAAAAHPRGAWLNEYAPSR